MGQVISFPGGTGPTFDPPAAVKETLLSVGCDAVISVRLPREWKRAMICEAFVSNAQFSRHIASIIGDHIQRQGLHSLLVATDRLKRAA